MDRTSYSLFRTLLPISIADDDDDNDNDNNYEGNDDSIFMEEEKKLLTTVVKAYSKSIAMTPDLNNKDIQKVINFKIMLKKVKENEMFIQNMSIKLN